MITQYIILSVIVLFSPLMPPILVPFSYSLISVLLLQKADPQILSLACVGSATVGTVIIWFVQGIIIRKLAQEQFAKKDNFFSHLMALMYSYYLKKKKDFNKAVKWEKYIQTRTGKLVIFLFAIFCYIPVIPDIISTRFLYKKIKFPYFLIALIIGKTITFLPFIFLGKSIIQWIWGEF